MPADTAGVEISRLFINFNKTNNVNRHLLMASYSLTILFSLAAFIMIVTDNTIAKVIAVILLILNLFWSLMNAYNVPPKEMFDSIEDLDQKKLDADESWKKAEKLSRVIGIHEAVKLWREKKNELANVQSDYKTEPFQWFKAWIRSYQEANPEHIVEDRIIKWIDSQPQNVPNE